MMRRSWGLFWLAAVVGCLEPADGRPLGEFDHAANGEGHAGREDAPGGGELPTSDGDAAHDTGPVSPISEDDEAAMLALTNDARAAAGLPPLKLYWDLVDDARAQAQAMIDAGHLFHNPDLGEVTLTTWSKLGENVGRGGSPASLQTAFMASPGHAANVLEPGYDYVGIGGIRVGGVLWVALVFMDSPISGLEQTLGPFTDDDGSIFEASIKAIYDAGITVGCSPAPHPAFCPDATVTRAQMAVFLDRALELPPTGTDFFVDDDGQWFEPAVNRIAAAGITLGCGEDLYCGHDDVTRGQMAAFLARALDLPPAVGDYFTDDAGRFYEASANRMKEAGITLGCNAAGTLYCGEDPVTRGQMAAFLDRALGLP